VSDTLEQVMRISADLSDDQYARQVGQVIMQSFHDPRIGTLLSARPAPSANVRGEEKKRLSGHGVLSEDRRILDQVNRRGIALQAQHLFPTAQPGDLITFDVQVGYTVQKNVKAETGPERAAEEVLAGIEGSVNPALLERWKRRLEEG